MQLFTERDARNQERDGIWSKRDISEIAGEVEKLPEGAIEIIRDRLEIAAKLIERTSGRTKPKAPTTAWPVMARLKDDKDENCPDEEMADADNRTMTLAVTARQITQAEEAMQWRRYVNEAQPLAALNIWMRCKALRIRSWQKEAVRHGFSRETAKRRLTRAYILIAVGLCRDGIDIAEPHR